MAVNFYAEAPFFGLFDASTGEAVAAGGTVTLTDAPAFAILGSGETVIAVTFRGRITRGVARERRRGRRHWCLG